MNETGYDFSLMRLEMLMCGALGNWGYVGMEALRSNLECRKKIFIGFVVYFFLQ